MTDQQSLFLVYWVCSIGIAALNTRVSRHCYNLYAVLFEKKNVTTSVTLILSRHTVRFCTRTYQIDMHKVLLSCDPVDLSDHLKNAYCWHQIFCIAVCISCSWIYVRNQCASFSVKASIIKLHRI